MRKIVKRLIIAVALLLTIFAGISIAWLIHYNTLIAPMLKNENLEYEGISSYWKKYSAHDEDNRIGYTVAAPRFLRFIGNISVITGTSYDEDWNLETDYTYSLLYNPRLFSNNLYDFTVRDYTDCESMGDIPKTYSIFLDKDWNLVSESEEGIYEEFKDEIHSFFNDHVLAFFGSEAFE